ncbi:MAG: tRNA (guanosine(46)-N7)-methyltransferase TrmB [Anaerovoracaceae bacterium]|uniref:tRNA (guanine-N(7)-)-methyltransferase n=1 Tax=Candidatus Fimisoma avicola TaxID=2840826 RepID=A0A9D1I314_9FIRM|nr:tRNA (guanosine(46)-N7)-methyltransferase TrmB [Candidatus Fimisoma avicola]
MRQRNIKNLDQKIRRNSTFLVTDPESCRGRWREVFGNNAPVYLEIGCGKGRFIALRAAAFPEKNFIAVEGQSNVALRALQKAEICHFDNLRIFIDYVDDLGRYFEPGELAGIYLNFSDPWPKARHAKRRLTYREKLKNYRSVMSPEGTIEFKTDNDGLFAFTIDEIRNAGLSIWEMTTDLAASTFESKLFTTEYEERFGSAGKNINYVKFK